MAKRYISAIAFLVVLRTPLYGQPTSIEIGLDQSFGIAGLADINAIAVFSSDSQHLFAATQRRIQVFRCADGQLVSTVQLLSEKVNPKPGTVRRLAFALEGSHYCGQVSQGYQDVGYRPVFKLRPDMSLGRVNDEGTVYNRKKQFHHPCYLKVIHNGSKLLAGVAQREAFLLDIQELVARRTSVPELLFRFKPETELSSFVSTLDNHRYVFLREDVQIPEVHVRPNGKPSEPAEQRIAGRLVVFDSRTGRFEAKSTVELENPFNRNVRRRFQVFTLLQPKSQDSKIQGIQIGCLLDDTPATEAVVPFRRFMVSWDSSGAGNVAYGDANIVNAQPHMISPDLRFYVSANDVNYHRGLALPRIGTLRPGDVPTRTGQANAVVQHYWSNSTLQALFSPDGSLCAINDVRIGSTGNLNRKTTVAILDSSTRKQLFRLPTGNANEVTAIAFSPNARYVLTVKDPIPLGRGIPYDQMKAVLWDLKP